MDRSNYNCEIIFITNLLNMSFLTIFVYWAKRTYKVILIFHAFAEPIKSMSDITAYLKKNNCEPAAFGLFSDCKDKKVLYYKFVGKRFLIHYRIPTWLIGYANHYDIHC